MNSVVVLILLTRCRYQPIPSSEVANYESTTLTRNFTIPGLSLCSIALGFVVTTSAIYSFRYRDGLL